MKSGECNSFGGIFINYGELYDNYQHSSDYKFRTTVDYVKEKHTGGNNFPHLLKSKAVCEIRT